MVCFLLCRHTELLLTFDFFLYISVFRCSDVHGPVTVPASSQLVRSAHGDKQATNETLALFSSPRPGQFFSRAFGAGWASVLTGDQSAVLPRHQSLLNPSWKSHESKNTKLCHGSVSKRESSPRPFSTVGEFPALNTVFRFRKKSAAI